MCALSALSILFVLSLSSATRFQPNWESLDSRPLPSWYDESKIAEFYDPYKWADIFNASGAKYVVLVTKHHEGFTNWPSKYAFNWNAMDVGPNRDLVGDLANAIRKKTDIHFGSKTMPELYELVNNYKPDVVWSDGDWMVDDTYWNSTQFLAWLYNDSPVKDTVVVNDRWGKNCRCKHGGFWNCHDRFVPGQLIKHKWENCMTLDKGSWGFRRDAPLSAIYSMDDFISLLVKTVSFGGNLLVNVGPTSYGEITPIYEERLRQLGQWLGVNGEAIYGTRPWTYQNDTSNPDVWYTSKKQTNGTSVYAILLKWPTGQSLTLGAPSVSSQTRVSLLGYSGAPFKFSGQTTQGVTITIPAIPFTSMPCQWAWVMKLENLANQ
ncbi:hypothetical protein BaRGS_00017538 [Batillaria attramentaria]|uniref:alpha-L-fucosidase n=1 Tax=Batillaria attramentaria TaxID=370345 RepID=A0ABD0KVM4_9CAEN